MPRRDVVLTGLVAFGAGVAVGANWPKLRKQVGPLLEKLGLQMADLGDFLSAATGEDIKPEFKAAAPKAKRSKARSPKTKIAPNVEAFPQPMARRNGAPKRKASPRKTPVAVPAANGTYGS